MKDFSDTLFQKTYTEVVDLKDSTIPDERLDELFDCGHISSKEYSFLIRKLYSTEKKISVYSVLCLVVSAISWVSFLKFEFGDDVYQLMSGSMRFKVVSFLAPMAVFFAVLAFREIKSRNRNGVEVAIVGCTIAIAQLTIIIPVWLMKLY